MGDSVAVIIPAYNAARQVVRAVDSALAQTAPPAEIIVIDDGSGDDTAVVVGAMPPPVRLLRKPNGGSASARNLGARHATADWLAFLDADDWWWPEKLKTQLALANDPAVALVHCPTELRDDAKQAQLGFSDLWDGNSIVISSVIVRRAVFETLGAFDESPALAGVEDHNLWLRVTATHWRIVTCHHVLAHHTGGIGLSSPPS